MKKILIILGLIGLVALAGYTATYRFKSTPNVTETQEVADTLFEHLGDTALIVDFKHVAAFTEVQDGTKVVYQPILCDPDLRGQFQFDDQSGVLIFIGDAPRFFKIIGNYQGDKTVLELVDLENKPALFYTRTLDDGSQLWAIQTLELLVIFSDVPHPCHGVQEKSK